MTDITAREFNPSNNEKVDRIKEMINEIGDYIEGNIPPSRRRSISMTKLEEASMWAVKSVFYTD